MFVYDPKRKSFRACGLPQRYYCQKCKHIHYFDSKIGKQHVEFGKFPDFPFMAGTIIEFEKKKKGANR